MKRLRDLTFERVFKLLPKTMQRAWFADRGDSVQMHTSFGYAMTLTDARRVHDWLGRWIAKREEERRG